MSKVLVSDTYLQDIADAIRAKTGGSATITPAAMAGEIANIPSGGGGDDQTLGRIIAGTEVNWDESTITGIASYALYFRTNLKTVRARACETLAMNAFGTCSSMSLLYLPKLTSITTYSISGCGGLLYVWLGPVTDIPAGSFSSTQNISKLVVDNPTPPTLGSSSEFTNAQIYVPAEAVDTYKAATNWNTIASRINPITQEIIDFFDNYVAP